MDQSSTDANTSECYLELTAFEAERDRVCEFFAAQEGKHQPGQLTRTEYILVGAFLVVTFALVLILQ